MKFSQFKRVLKEDLQKAGGEIPKWLDQLLGPINLFIENVALALQNRINFTDNFYCKEMQVTLTSAVEYELNPTTSFAPTARAYGIIVINSDNKAISSFQWRNKNNGNAGVTIVLTSAVDADCLLLILLR